MSVRAKFYVTEKRFLHGIPSEVCEVKMAPIFEGKDGVDGNTNENRHFAKYSPQGSFSLMIANPPAAEFFEVGKNYYLDFTKADQ